MTGLLRADRGKPPKLPESKFLSAPATAFATRTSYKTRILMTSVTQMATQMAVSAGSFSTDPKI